MVRRAHRLPDDRGIARASKSCVSRERRGSEGRYHSHLQAETVVSRVSNFRRQFPIFPEEDSRSGRLIASLVAHETSKALSQWWFRATSEVNFGEDGS